MYSPLSSSKIFHTSGWLVAGIVIASPSVYSIVLHSMAIIGLISVFTSERTQATLEKIYKSSSEYLSDTFPQLKTMFVSSSAATTKGEKNNGEPTGT